MMIFTQSSGVRSCKCEVLRTHWPCVHGQDCGEEKYSGFRSCKCEDLCTCWPCVMFG